MHHLRRSARGRVRGYVAVALLLGVTLGVCFTAVAGARRTQSAYPRFLRWGNAATMSLTGGALDDAGIEAKVSAFPEVASSTSYMSFQTNVLVDGRPDFTQNVEPVGTIDGRYYDMDRFAVTRGRMPNRQRIDEVAMNEFAAAQFGYRVGQELDLATYDSAAVEDPSFYGHPPPPKLRTHVTIVGIGLFSDEVLQDDGDRTTRMLVTPAFSRQAQRYALYSLQGVVLRRGDADIAAVKARYEAIAPPGTAIYRVTSTDEFHAVGATRPLAIALGLFGGIAGLAGLLLVGQGLGRLIRVDRHERAVLRAIGAGPRSIAATMLAAPVVTILAGTLLAVVLAIVLSPLMPLGPVRRVEVDRGIDLDLTVLLGGSLLVVLLLLVATLLVVRSELPHRLVARDRRPTRPSRVVAAAGAGGAGAPAIVGLRFSLEPGDATTAVAVRSVIPSAAVAILALVASITFGTSLRSLVDQPARYGWAWQLTAFDANGYGNFTTKAANAVLDADPDVAAWSGTYFGSEQIDGADVPVLGIAPGATVLPPILSGRAAASDSEVVLGAGTARLLHKGLGDFVTLRNGTASHRLTVVGLATLPTVGIVHGAHPSLGVGAIVAPRLVPGFDRDLTTTRTGSFGPNAIFIRLRKGADVAAARARLTKALAPTADFGGSIVFGAQRPAEIVNSSSVGTAPAVLAAALALGAMISLGLALTASVRRRSRDLALLKSLGFTRRQLSATVRWQATSTIVVSLLVGLPVGIAVGRWSWLQFAHQLDVVPTVTVSPLVVLAVAVLILLVANAAALRPARQAARIVATTRPTTD